MARCRLTALVSGMILIVTGQAVLVPHPAPATANAEQNIV